MNFFKKLLNRATNQPQTVVEPVEQVVETPPELGCICRSLLKELETGWESELVQSSTDNRNSIKWKKDGFELTILIYPWYHPSTKRNTYFFQNEKLIDLHLEKHEKEAISKRLRELKKEKEEEETAKQRAENDARLAALFPECFPK